MKHLIIEIKARCDHSDQVHMLLRQRGAEFIGIDRQIDTYFKCPAGRLKLRQGNIENYLIHYDREDKAGPKRSVVTLHKIPSDSAQLRTILAHVLDVDVVVRKTREIYFIDNVKFHLDQVDGLGQFIEIEAIDENEEIGEAVLLSQCHQYISLLRIADADLIEKSYSDLLREKQAS